MLGRLNTFLNNLFKLTCVPCSDVRFLTSEFFHFVLQSDVDLIHNNNFNDINCHNVGTLPQQPASSYAAEASNRPMQNGSNDFIDLLNEIRSLREDHRSLALQVQHEIERICEHFTKSLNKAMTTLSQRISRVEASEVSHSLESSKSEQFENPHVALDKDCSNLANFHINVDIDDEQLIKSPVVPQSVRFNKGSFKKTLLKTPTSQIKKAIQASTIILTPSLRSPKAPREQPPTVFTEELIVKENLLLAAYFIPRNTNKVTSACSSALLDRLKAVPAIRENPPYTVQLANFLDTVWGLLVHKRKFVSTNNLLGTAEVKNNSGDICQH